MLHSILNYNAVLVLLPANSACWANLIICKRWMIASISHLQVWKLA